MKSKTNLFFIIFALLFILTLLFHPYPFSHLIKAVPALLSSIVGIFAIKNRTDALLLGTGFLFCMAEDIFLDLNRELYFVQVVAYMVVIGIMGITAAFIKTELPYIFIGASLFVFSDSIIAISKFLYPFQASPYFIMFFYFSSLFFIQFGARKEFADI